MICFEELELDNRINDCLKVLMEENQREIAEFCKKEGLFFRKMRFILVLPLAKVEVLECSQSKENAISMLHCSINQRSNLINFCKRQSSSQLCLNSAEQVLI